MLFNSFEFLIFLPVVLILYWAIPRKYYQIQNVLLLISSYVFYGWWDWRFLSLILISSLSDFIIGMSIFRTDVKRNRKILLITSLIVNLGLLGFFKYYNFFIDSFIDAFSTLGFNVHVSSMQIILPIGISFYTFQTLSYTIDIYRRKIEPTGNIITFFTFVSFFPQLVAGPIERAKNLLPQFTVQRKFDFDLAIDGLKQTLWGFFKKLVIADNAAIIVERIFSNTPENHGWIMLLGLFMFSFQVYGDFSGYSDIAIGIARFFGIRLSKNFAYPFFARDIAEFWRRWHISLTSWFKDYLYIPLGGSRVSTWKKVRNVLIIFTVSGFWHGANWTYIFWGFLNGLYFLPLMLLKMNRSNIEIIAHNSFFPTLRDIAGLLITSSAIQFSFIFFRSQDMPHAWIYLNNLFDFSSDSRFDFTQTHILVWIAVLLLFEWFNRKKELQLNGGPIVLRWMAYIIIFYITLIFGNYNSNEFIYFQF